MKLSRKDEIDDLGLNLDLNIDCSIFEKYNKKFEIIDKIDSTLKEYDEDKLTIYLKNILEDSTNPVNKMYKDKKCKKKQFYNAYESIQKENEIRPNKNLNQHIMLLFQKKKK